MRCRWRSLYATASELRQKGQRAYRRSICSTATPNQSLATVSSIVRHLESHGTGLAGGRVPQSRCSLGCPPIIEPFATYRRLGDLMILPGTNAQFAAPRLCYRRSGSLAKNDARSTRTSVASSAPRRSSAPHWRRGSRRPHARRILARTVCSSRRSRGPRSDDRLCVLARRGARGSTRSRKPTACAHTFTFRRTVRRRRRR